MSRQWSCPTEPAQPAPAADGVKVGTRFLHSRQIRSVPGVLAKDSPHEECRVTAVRSGRVYFRNTTGYLSVVALENFGSAVLEILP